MNHKNIIFQNRTESGNKVLAAIFFALALCLILAAFVVAGINTSSRYSVVEWMLRYIEAYVWFFIGASLFALIGCLLNIRKQGVFTVTDMYICMETGTEITILPIDQLTSVRKVNTLLVVSTANVTLQVADIPSVERAIAVIMDRRAMFFGEN